MKRIILLTLTEGIPNIKMRLGDFASAPHNTRQTAENLILAIALNRMAMMAIPVFALKR